MLHNVCIVNLLLIYLFSNQRILWFAIEYCSFLKVFGLVTIPKCWKLSGTFLENTCQYSFSVIIIIYRFFLVQSHSPSSQHTVGHGPFMWLYCLTICQFYLQSYFWFCSHASSNFLLLKKVTEFTYLCCVSWFLCGFFVSVNVIVLAF